MKNFLLLSLVVSAVVCVPHFSKVRANFVDSYSMAAELIDLTNLERERAGLERLTENPALTKAAYDKASDMLERGYFSHTSPENKAFYRWVDSAGYEYAAVAENLAVNLNMVSAEEMVSSWLDSPTHRENLLSNVYTEAGIGVSSGAYQGQSAVFAVHVFAKPKNKTAQLEAEDIEIKESSFMNIKKASASIEEGTEELTTSSSTSSAIYREKGDMVDKSWVRKIIDFILAK